MSISVEWNTTQLRDLHYQYMQELFLMEKLHKTI